MVSTSKYRAGPNGIGAKWYRHLSIERGQMVSTSKYRAGPNGIGAKWYRHLSIERGQMVSGPNGIDI